MQNIWPWDSDTSTSLHSTVRAHNVHITTIVSWPVDFPVDKIKPIEFIKKGSSDKSLWMPIEDYMRQGTEDTFKLPKEFLIKVRGYGYNAFVKSFVVYFSN